MTSGPELAERLRWFVRLRWWAVGGIVLAAVLVAALGMGVSWPILLALAGLLGGLNVAFGLLARRGAPPLALAWWQVVVDLAILTLALHVAGGIDNPFVFFYVFHVIIAAILLPRRTSYVVAALASLFYVAMAVLEHGELVPHADLGLGGWRDPRAVAASSLVLASTLFIATYLASTIMEGLRRKDEEMRRFHERLLQTEKLAGLGQLAAGIAHELNTPLASIAGYAEELAELSRGNGEKIVRYTDVIRSQTERCRAITRSLLNFARKSEFRLQPVDVNALLREAIDYLRFKKRQERLEIVTELGPAPPVQADPGQLLQVFLSVLVNAADAVEPEGGTIRVESSGGRDVRVRIADTGCGIPPENLKKIFEPFFTTKGPGQGTGLGLSLSYGIVRQLGGSIEVRSEVGQGTEVLIVLPAGEPARER
ncbi:MAG TPA: ATP-binding protein [Planctomycetota bacterium]|nr:ATP-binding protein [Planctomycetota bacterium]